MDEKTYDEVHKLTFAVKAFTRSVEKSFHMGMYDGTGELIVRQYNGLHGKVRQLLPDHFSINEVLALETINESVEDEKVLAQVMLNSEQLLNHLESLVTKRR